MTGVIRAEHGAKGLRAGLCRGDALLVEVVAEDVDAVGAGQVVEHITIDVGDGDAGRRLHEGAGRKMLAHQPAILKRHPVGFGELQVGDAARHFRRHLPPLGVAFLIEAGQRKEGVATLLGDLGRRAVGAEEIVGGKFVERDQPRHPPRHLRVSGQRAVLGPRQRQACLQFGKHGHGAGYRCGG